MTLRVNNNSKCMKMVRRERNEEGLTCQYVQRLLLNKFVVIIGDSIQRSIYKDLVSLLQQNEILSDRAMKMKGELTFMGDDLVEGGVRGQLNNGVNYTEVRQYATNTHLVRFYFVTRCYNQYVESIMSDLSEGPTPDLVIMNSCLWDMTRYGTTAIVKYKENMAMLFCRLLKVLPPHCLMIWNTTLPISKDARGGFLVQEVEYKKDMLRMDVLEANYFARQVVVNHGFDILDLHFWFRRWLHWRVHDGIHWCPEAHRRISELLLTHVAGAWGFALPPISFPYFGNGNSGHIYSETQHSSSAIPSITEVNMDFCESHRPLRHGPTSSSSINRHNPYPLMPVQQTNSSSYYGCRQSNSYSCSRNRGDDYSRDSNPQYCNWNDSMQKGSYTSGLNDFRNGWTDYADDNFQGAQRRQYRSIRSHQPYC